VSTTVVYATPLDALPRPTSDSHGWRFLNSVNDLVERTIAKMSLTDAQAAFVRANFKVFSFDVELLHDNGIIQSYDAYRVWCRPGLLPEHDELRHNWPVKGGLKYALVMDLYEAAALSMLMMYKCAARGLPFYGAKGGICIDSRSLSDDERARLDDAFAIKLVELGIAGPENDVPASDYGTGPFDMDRIAAKLATFFPEHPYATITGKSLGMGGLPGRTESTGYISAICIHEYANMLGLPAEGRTFALQGLGKVGRHDLLRLVQLGWKPVMVSDIGGATHNAAGLNPVHLLEWFDAGRPLSEFPGGVARERDSIFETECTALILAVSEMAVTAANAHLIRATIVAEPANFGVDSAAEAIIAKMPGVHVVPCELNGSGGVYVSGMELDLALDRIPGASVLNPPEAADILALAEREALADLRRMVHVRETYGLSTKMAGIAAGIMGLLYAHYMMD
jgi:glutamate dehydrogenase (NAD(P)+)